VQSDAELFLVEVDIVLTDHLFFGDRINVEQVLADFSADEVILDDLFDIAHLDGVIQGIFREDFDERSLRAEAEAANVVDADFLLEPVGFDFLLEFVKDLVRVIG